MARVPKLPPTSRVDCPIETQYEIAFSIARAASEKFDFLLRCACQRNNIAADRTDENGFATS